MLVLIQLRISMLRAPLGMDVTMPALGWRLMVFLALMCVFPCLVNRQLPHLITADVAVFASRCEGGTNLMAMETLACGVPTLSVLTAIWICWPWGLVMLCQWDRMDPVLILAFIVLMAVIHWVCGVKQI